MTLEARRLMKQLGGRVLYRDLDLRVEEGSTLVVRGDSGAGKSQLLRQLSGLDPDAGVGLQQTGTVTFQGRDLAGWGPYDWRAEICCVPQQAPRLEGAPFDLEQRISALHAQVSRPAEDARALASKFGLDAESWERPFTELSVGERQRALLAVLVSRRPGVLLLDEPTAALDEKSALAVEQHLHGLTCVWVTHSAEQAERVADEVLTLPGSVHAS